MQPFFEGPIPVDDQISVLRYAEEASKRGEKVILVRNETSPEDVHGMMASKGILTARGGMTSHAAVVARGMGRPCVSGAGALSMDDRDITRC